METMKCAVVGCKKEAVIVPKVTPLCEDHGKYWIEKRKAEER